MLWMMDTAALWEAFSTDLRTWLRRQTRDVELAEELLQETFLKVHAALPGLRDQQRMAPWLYRLARSALIDHHRPRHARVPGRKCSAQSPHSAHKILSHHLRLFREERRGEEGRFVAIGVQGDLTT